MVLIGTMTLLMTFYMIVAEYCGIESPKDAQEAAGSVAASLRRFARGRRHFSETKVPKAADDDDAAPEQIVVTPHGGGALWDRFCDFDADGSGVLEAAELRALLWKCTGAEPSEKEVAKMMASVDKNSDGVVDFAEFSEIHRKALDGSLEFRALADALMAQMDDDDSDAGAS